MNRLIEIRPMAQGLPQHLTVGVGDVLSFSASGGRVLRGDAVELVGVLVPGVVATDGRILSPEGPPGTVLFRARHPGRSTLTVVTGGPSLPPAIASTVDVVVSTTSGGCT